MTLSPSDYFSLFSSLPDSTRPDLDHSPSNRAGVSSSNAPLPHKSPLLPRARRLVCMPSLPNPITEHKHTQKTNKHIQCLFNHHFYTWYSQWLIMSVISTQAYPVSLNVNLLKQQSPDVFSYTQKTMTAGSSMLEVQEVERLAVGLEVAFFISRQANSYKWMSILDESFIFNAVWSVIFHKTRKLKPN